MYDQFLFTKIIIDISVGSPGVIEILPHFLTSHFAPVQQTCRQFLISLNSQKLIIDSFCSMILMIILGVLIILATHLAYISLRCARSKSYFANHARQIGYKVFEHPFCWLGSAMYGQFKKQQIKHNDAHHHYKNELTTYDIIVSNVLFSTMVEIESPELAKEFFLKANEGYYAKSDFGLGHLRRLIRTQNLLLSEGEYWKDRRKIISSVFNFDFITQQIPKIQHICKSVFNTLGQPSSEEINCDISAPLLAVFSTVILKCFFKGDEITHIGKQKTTDFIDRMVLQISEVGRSKAGVFLGIKFAQKGLTPKNRAINNQVKEFRKAVRQIILKRIKQIKEGGMEKQGEDKGQPEDILEALIKNKQIKISETEQEEGRATEKQEIINIDNLINEFVTFYLAGSETTLSFTRMMIYRLASYPQITAKIREEFERQVNTQQISLAQLKNLKYFEKVQKQVLRMDSSIGAIFTRLAQKDHYLGNLQIRKGTAVNIRLRATHYKQSEYPNPLQFCPERWDEGKTKNTPFAFLPFSAGARNCIGKHLALLENKIFMIQLLRKFKEIKISKDIREVKMRISPLYAPEKLVTTLIRK